MKRVMLLSLPAYEEYEENLYPLGIAYLSAVLKKNNHNVQAYHYDHIEIAKKEIIQNAIIFKPDIIGFTCSSFNRANVKLIIKILRKKLPETLYIVGGVHATFCAEQILRYYQADIVVIGEGELTLKEICDLHDIKNNLHKILGIAYLNNGVFIENPSRPPIEDLDELPFPDYSFVEKIIEKTKMGFIITSRGCPNRCSFCSTASYWGQKVRMYSPKRVVDEMEYLINTYNVNKIFFHDDTFNLNLKRVNEIYSLIKERKLKVEWSIDCRVSPINEEAISNMVSVGLRHIAWGVESGSKELIKSIGKNITLEQVRYAFDLSAKYNSILSSSVFRMVGNPGENESTVKESIDFFNELPMTDLSGCSILYILPGTPLYKKIKEEGKINEDNWYKYNGIPYYTLENSYQKLKKWAEKIALSGKIIPFDKSKHFWKDRYNFENVRSVVSLKRQILNYLRKIKRVLKRPRIIITYIILHLPKGKIRFY